MNLEEKLRLNLPYSVALALIAQAPKVRDFEFRCSLRDLLEKDGKNVRQKLYEIAQSSTVKDDFISFIEEAIGEPAQSGPPDQILGYALSGIFFLLRSPIVFGKEMLDKHKDILVIGSSWWENKSALADIEIALALEQNGRKS